MLIGALVLVTTAAIGGSAIGDGLDDLPPGERFVANGAVASTQGIYVRRSKMYIKIDEDNPLWGILFYGEWNACSTPRRPVACPPGQAPNAYSGSLRVGWPFEPLPDACVPTRIPDETTQYVRSKLTLVSTKSRRSSTDPVVLDEVGGFPKVRVNLLAFGSIPATATLRMSMTKKGGKTPPWTVHVWNPTGYGDDGSGRCSSPTVYYRALVEGQVDIRLENLRVDGVAVDLGSSCRTSRPVDLALWGAKGYEALSGGLLSQRIGADKGDGTVVPLRTPGFPERNGSIYFEDEGRMIPASSGVDIPPFTGCGVTEDLDPLITALASGPGNPLRVAQGRPMARGYDPDDLSACETADQCPTPPPAPKLLPEDE